jgi:hypothetical protein
MGNIKKMIEHLDPEVAMVEITAVVKDLFPHISEKLRMDFIYALIGDSDNNSLPGLVHL